MNIKFVVVFCFMLFVFLLLMVYGINNLIVYDFRSNVVFDEICKGVMILFFVLYVSCVNYNRVQIYILWQEGCICGKFLDNVLCDYI